MSIQGQVGDRANFKIIELGESENNFFPFERRLDGFSMRLSNGIKVIVEICKSTGYAVIKIMYCHNQNWCDITTEIIGDDHWLTTVDEYIYILSKLRDCFIDGGSGLHVPIIDRGVRGCVGPIGPKGI